MHILNLSTDKKIFDAKSRVAERMIMIGDGVLLEYHIIVFTKRSEGYSDVTLSKNVFVYPTNSYSAFGFKKDALRIAQKLQNEGKLPVAESLVTAQNPFEIGLIGVVIAKKLRLPLEVQIHTDFLSPHYRHMSWRHQLHPILAKRVIPKAQGVRVVSPTLLKQLRALSYCNVPITILPVFAELRTVSDAHGRRRSRGQSMLMISRLAKEKNVIAGVRICRDIFKDFPEATLTIVGDGPEQSAIETYIKKNSLTDKVKLVGHQEDVQPFLSSTDVFLHTSYFEGYGLVFLEAGMMSVPIVSYDVGIAPDFKEAGGALVCPVGKEICIAHHVKDILNNKEIGEEMGARARQYALRILWNKTQYVEALIGNWQNLITQFRL